MIFVLVSESRRMVVFDTLGESLTLLRRHPKLLAYLAVVVTVTNVLSSGDLLGLSASGQLLLGALSLVVGPAIAVGTAGLVNDTATEDRVSGGAFAASVLQNYLPWVAAIIVIAVVSVVAVLVFAIAFQIPLVNVLAALAFLVLALAAALTLQFVDLAIVVDDEGPVEGIKRSYGVATAHLGSVIGYTLLEVVVFIVILIPAVVALLGTGWPESRPFIEPTPGLLAAFAIAILGTVVVQTWRVLFYRRLSDRFGR